jgi:MerR family transcriptional regulator, Zn(II)-responsive regulator of zntA
MYLVNELTKKTGVTADAVRHYTRLGLLNPSKNPDNGYKNYSANDVKRLRFIYLAKRLGFSLQEITQIFEDCEKGNSPCPRVREIIQRRIHDNRKILEQQMALQQRMENALKRWHKMKDGVPDGHTICVLIESFGDEEYISDNYEIKEHMDHDVYTEQSA